MTYGSVVEAGVLTGGGNLIRQTYARVRTGAFPWVPEKGVPVGWLEMVDPVVLYEGGA